MKSAEILEGILHDIEFEIMQGVVREEEVTQAFEEVRRYQNEVRQQAARILKINSPYRELVSKQFQINDMLVILLQESVRRIQAMQLEQRRLNRFYQESLTHADLQNRGREGGMATKDLGAAVEEIPWDWRPTEDVQKAMKEKTIHVEMLVSPVNIPLIGWLVNRVRTFLHRVALYYIHHFEKKQVQVNQIYGDWILHLNDLAREQQKQIEELYARIEIQKTPPESGDKDLETQGPDQSN